MNQGQLWDQVMQHLSGNPIVLALVMLALAYMAVSKRLAQISGPIGAIARWWNGRQVARVKRDRELWAEQHARDREQESAEIDQLREDVSWLRHELSDMRRREQIRDQQARDHTDWDNDVVSRLQAAGIPVSAPPPPLYLDLAPLHVDTPLKESRGSVPR